MINNKNEAHRSLKRLKWLRSASILAAASAMVASGAPALAQSGPGGAASVHVRLPQNASDLRVLNNQPAAPVNITNVRPLNPTIVTTRALPTPPNAAATKSNAVAPNVRAQMSINPASPPASTLVTTTPNPATTRTIAAVPSTPAPRAATSVDGLSVNATAMFDDAQVLFTPSVSGDTVEILGTSAIIDWATFDIGNGTPISFLDAGNNLLFTSDNSDYTVLNRISTTFLSGFDSPVLIDGNVSSTVFGGALRGGNVWFSSPGGIIIGSNATFNIGSLLLTSSEIDPNDVVAGASSFNFLGVSDPASSVEIQSGAQINAVNSNSYVAIVAPRIVQEGTVNVNGSVAYVAAEEATLTIQNNLFDITVEVGSEDENGIIHDGTTTGPASLGVADEQAIYFVAVPKNDALTMLLSGDIGYAAAGTATESNGQIILTTGSRVEREEVQVFDGGTFVNTSINNLDTSVDGGAAGSIALEDVNFTSDARVFAEDTVSLRARTTVDGDTDVVAGSTGNIVDLDLIGGDAVNIAVSEVGLIDISGSLNVTAGDGVGNGGEINVSVDFDDTFSSPDGGTLSVGGNLTLDASGQGLDDNGRFRNNGGNGIGGDGVGGDISVSVGQFAGLSVDGSFEIDVSANGGSGEIQHGSAEAGSVSLSLGQGFLSVGGDLSINAAAQVAGTNLAVPTESEQGSDSIAGNVTLLFDGGGADLGALIVNAGATASEGENSAIEQSNDATGGRFSLDIMGGAHFFGSINVDVSAIAANSFDDLGAPRNGLAERGNATINITSFDTLVDVGDSIVVNASTSGGVSAPVGDTVALNVNDTGFSTSAGLTIGGGLNIDADAQQGAPGDLTQAGNISVTTDNGQLIANSLFLTADAGNRLNDVEDASDQFQGGNINITSTNNGTVSVSAFSQLSANGTGVPDEDNPASGIGLGGTVTLLADNSAISFADFLSIEANGFATPGSSAGNQAGEGIGGTVTITVQGDTGRLRFDDLSAGTDGTFAFDGEVVDTSFAGTGSAGRGGFTQFNVLGGTLTAEDITVSSDGEGGPAGEFANGIVNPVNGLQSTGDGGEGIGGEVVFNLNGGNATVANLEVTANGIGGDGAPGSITTGTNAGDGGDASGGSATFNAISGNLTVTDTLVVEATGNTGVRGGTVGGAGGFGDGSIGGIGGNSAGGAAVFNLDGTAIVSASEVLVSTQAFGGAGGNSRADSITTPDQGGGAGGNAAGGSALFNDVAGNLTFNVLTVDSSGQGGQGGSSQGITGLAPQAEGGQGGDGTGGRALISLNQDDAASKTYSVLSQGSGGDGGDGAFAGGGGAGIGGTAELAVNDVAVIFEALTIDAAAAGGSPGTITGEQVADGDDGGDARGGDARLRVSGANASFIADSAVSITAGATGAQGGLGSISINDIDPSGNGGSGGNASGGSATIAVEDGALITIDVADFILNTDGVGGVGANGQANLFGGTAGAGGDGGDATGGAVAIAAARGGEVTITTSSGPLELASTGIGGAGGVGGNVDAGTGVGAGGVGGDGTGGSPVLSAVGGTINIDSVNLFATGIGGDGGRSGVPLNNPVDTLPGQGGNGTGGTPRIEAIEGSPGVLNLGDVVIVASGGAGAGIVASVGSAGQVTISDTSIDPDGLITIDNLAILATGSSGTDSGLISISSDSGPITVNGIFDLDVDGDIEVALEGDGQLLINPGGSLLDAMFNASRNITVSHQNPVSGISAIAGGSSISATASGGTFDASAMGAISAGSTVVIEAEDIAYSTIVAPSGASLTATSGSITGTADGAIIASNLADAILLNAAQDITFGTLTAANDGRIFVNAGGDINGGTVDGIEPTFLTAVGTISVGEIDTTRASFAAGQVTIEGGGIDIADLNADGIINLTSTLDDVTVDALISTATANLTSANDINLVDTTAGILIVNAANDVNAGNLTTTAGFGDILLTVGGTASFDSLDSSRLINISATNITGGDAIAIGSVQYSAADAIAVGDVTSDDIANITLTTDLGGIIAGQLTTTQGNVSVDAGADGDIGGIAAMGGASVAIGSDLIIGDVTASGNGSIIVGGNLTAGNLFAGTTSPGLLLSVGGDADVESADTNGLLNVDVIGALSGGAFSGSQVDIDVGSLDVDSAEAQGSFLNIDAPGAVSVGNAASVFNSTINGASVNLDNGNFGSSLTVNSSTGDITGLGTITVTNTATLNAAANIAIGSLEATNIALTATGGNLQFNDLMSPNSITLNADGLIGATSPDEGNIVSGGAVELNASEIAIGDVTSDTSITANATDGDASFGALDAGTTITIKAKGSPVIASVTSGEDVALTGASISLNGGDVGGGLVLNALAGDISLNFDGLEQLVVAEGATFNATGDMSVTHTNNTVDTLSVAVGEGIRVDLDGSFDSGDGSIFSALGEQVFDVGGSITANDLRTGPGMLLTAQGSVTLNNATATGPQGMSNFRGITINAGLIDFGSGVFAYDSIANATITGEVTSYANIDITAGGNAVFTSDSNTAADNALIVNTGDDIIIESGALLSSANDPTDAFDPTAPFASGPNLLLNAGSEDNLLSTPLTPIASLVIDGVLDANDAAIVLEANAIEGLDSSLIAEAIKADVRNAPGAGFSLGNDDGLLSGACLEGIICLGNMAADNEIEIGLDSDNDAIQLIIEQADITATDISIITRNDIVFGTDGLNSELDAAGTLAVESLTGDVDFRDATISADQILITAAGSLLGSGVLTSGNDIGVTVGDSLIVGGIDTDGELTEVIDVGGDPEAFYDVSGSFVAGFFNQGTSSIDLSAGGDISIGNASSPSDVILSAAGAVFLDSSSVSGLISLDGSDADYGELDGGEVAISAFGSVTGSVIASASDVIIDGENIDVGDISAVNTAEIAGSAVAVGEVVGNDIVVTSLSDILFNGLTSNNAIMLDASIGLIGTNGGAGDITSDGDVALDALSIAIGDVTSLGSVSANAFEDAASFGLIDAVDAISINAFGAVTLDSTMSGGDTSVTGSRITANSIEAGGDVDVTAFAGSVTIDNTLSEGDITIAATADIDVDHAEATGNFTANGDAGITTGLNSIITGGDIVITVAGAADLGNSSAGGLADITASQIEFVSLVAGSTVDMFAATFIRGTTLTAADAVDLVAGIAGGAIGGQGFAGEIDLGTLTAPQADLLANGGPVTVADAIIDDVLIAEGTAINIASSTNLMAQTTANDGDISIIAQGTLQAALASATGNVTLASDNSDLIVNDAQGTNIDLSAANRVEISGIADAANNLSIEAFGSFDAINGSALGETIDILSANVALGSDSIIGNATRTNSITFETFAEMVIGGLSNDALPYQIDNFELSRIFSGGDLTFFARSDGSGFNALLTLDALNVAAGDGSSGFDQNFSQTSSLNFIADGDIDIVGNVNIANALADTEVILGGINLIRLDTANGGLFVIDDAGNLAGDVAILSDDFVAATDQALADIDGLSLAEIDVRLADSDGVNRPDGVIRANSLRIATLASDVFIQNTATGTDFDDRRGFEVNSLTIASGGSAAQPIVINGIVAGETGIDAIAVTTIGGTAAVSSTINGCVIADPASCGVTVTPPPPTAPPPSPPAPTPAPPSPSPPASPPSPPSPPPQEPTSDNPEVETRDLIDDGLAPPDVRPEGPLQGGLIDLTPESDFDDDPLIDDPVTGAGNEDFWIEEDEPCEDGGNCET